MPAFGAGDTSSNLVGGIQTKSWNRSSLFLFRRVREIYLHHPFITDADHAYPKYGDSNSRLTHHQVRKNREKECEEQHRKGERCNKDQHGIDRARELDNPV